MGLLSRFLPAKAEPKQMQPRALTTGELFSMDDPRLVDLIRGVMTESGASVSPETAMRNPSVFRSVTLIANAMGMLPTHLFERGDTKTKADAHPVFRVLHRRPNNWQTPFEFKSLMQGRACYRGNAYARIVRSRDRVMGLIPLDPVRVEPVQRADFSLAYRYKRPDGGWLDLAPEEVFHLRNLFSWDGISGVSQVRQAAEAIGLANQTADAQARLFRNGMMVGGALQMGAGKTLSPEAYERLKASMDGRTGAENAHKWLILEEGMEAKTFAHTAHDSQQIETRKHQIEEIGRVFGVPRPLLMMDETSWGSGIDVLGQFFVRYALQPWFTAWEQAVQRALLTDAEQDQYEVKFNAGALLRGSMKDQADFFSKALGSGGHAPWMTQDEVRDLMEMSQRGGHAGELGRGASDTRGESDEPPPTAED